MKRAFLSAEDRQTLLLKNARSVPFKSLDDHRSLSIHWYLPDGYDENASAPVLLFVNGGDWERGNVTQLAPHALHFVRRGAVCGLVEYRQQSTHPESTPAQALSDVADAIRHIRNSRKDSGSEPSKIVLIGASAGGLMAGLLAFGATDSPSGAPASPNSAPDYAVLISPLTQVAKSGYGSKAFLDSAERKRFSLKRALGSHSCPVLLIHGTDDRLSPYDQVTALVAEMNKKKLSVELESLEGREHEFFNLNFDPTSYEVSLQIIGHYLDKHHIVPSRSDGEEDTFLVSWRDND